MVDTPMLQAVFRCCSMDVGETTENIFPDSS